MTAKREHDQLEHDAQLAWAVGTQCLIRERELAPGEPHTPGSPGPLWSSRLEFTQAAHAHDVLVELDGDLDRLRAAARACQQEAERHQGDDLDYAAQHARAADLCERAAKLVIELGAASSERVRRILIAQCEYEAVLAACGTDPQGTGGAREELEAKLREIDAQCAPPPAPPEPLVHTGPSYDLETGLFEIARGADGSTAHWRLNTPGVGVEHGLIAGPPRIGKSNALRLVVTEARQSGLFVLWLTDPSGRRQLADLPMASTNKRAETPKDTVKLLRAACRIIERRLDLGGYAEPTRDRPAILLAVENCESLFADDLEATALAERIVTRGGPAGVSLVVTAPGTDLAHFGGNAALRRGLAAVNALPMGPDGPRMAAELDTGAAGDLRTSGTD